MKKHFKSGLALLIPIGMVVGVTYWLYDIIKGIIINLVPNYQWWYVIIALIGVILVIELLGLVFDWVKPLRLFKNAIDKYVIEKTPVVKTVYKFGKEITDSFITDIKEDGDLQVVEVMFGGQKTLGLLNDNKSNLVFIPTAPNPLNGFVIKAREYTETDITVVDFLKLLASLGKINGWRWK